MRTDKREKKVVNDQPVVRSLKIQPRIRVGKYHDTKEVPEIKLCGNWLSKLGFHYGERVDITAMNDVLIIKLQSK